MIQPIRPQDATGVYQRQIAQVAVEPAPRRDGARAQRGGGRSDQVTLSDQAQELRRILSAVSRLPEVRDQRIDFVRSEFDRGEYRMDALQIAERMLTEGLL